MSNTLAIAAVTATLQKLIEDAIQADDGSSKVTTRLPDKIADETNQLNLFLYHTEISAAWRNQNELPGQLKRGESGNPPLPLDLYYLLTAYGKSTPLGEEDGHKLLGRAMSVLHDHALLGADEIRNALPGNDLHQQIERVRITAQPLGIDEMNKLWGAFQTNYRLSVAYRVSLVLIESQRSKRAPLPVLTIGEGDSGIISQPSLIPPYPTLESITLPANQNSARLGDSITLVGHHLSGSAVEVRLVHPVLSSPIVVPSAAFAAAGNTAITFPIPNTGSAPRDFPAGFYAVIGGRDGRRRDPFDQRTGAAAGPAHRVSQSRQRAGRQLHADGDLQAPGQAGATSADVVRRQWQRDRAGAFHLARKLHRPPAR